MAFQQIHFQGPQETNESIFENAARQYKGLNAPNMLEQEMMMNQHKNQILGAEAQFAPQNEAEKYAQMQSKSFMDQLEAKYKEEQLLKDLELKHAQALHHQAQASPEHAARQFAPTEAKKYMDEYKDAVKKHGPESFEAQFARAALENYKNTYGEFANKNEVLSQIPGSYSLKGQPAGDVGRARAEMRSDIPKAQSMIEGSRLLDDLDKIITENPNLSESFAKIMESPNDSMWSSLKKLLTNQKERETLEKFRTITSQLIQKGAITFGAKSFTDARQKLIEQSKASSGLTFGANKYFIENMRHIFDAKKGQAQKDATKLGLKDNYYVPFDPEIFGEILSKGPEGQVSSNEPQMESSNPKVSNAGSRMESLATENPEDPLGVYK